MVDKKYIDAYYRIIWQVAFQVITKRNTESKTHTALRWLLKVRPKASSIYIIRKGEEILYIGSHVSKPHERVRNHFFKTSRPGAIELLLFDLSDDITVGYIDIPTFDLHEVEVYYVKMLKPTFSRLKVIPGKLWENI